MKKIELKRIWFCMLIALGCFLAQSAQAEDFPEITAEQLKSKMNAGENLLLINPLSDVDYEAKHIPGSINIPLEKMHYTEKLPKNKSQLIVTYCLGRK